MMEKYAIPMIVTVVVTGPIWIELIARLIELFIF